MEVEVDDQPADRKVLLRFQSCLLELAANYDRGFNDFVRRALKADAGILGADRVSFWRFGEPPEISREVMYSLVDDKYDGALLLREDDFPNYFAALRRDLVIAANDARTDPRTADLTERYLRRANITSMLDVPVWANGALAGVVCHEQVGKPHVWQPEEKAFAFSIGQLISNALEVDERRRIERELSETDERLRLFTSSVTDYSMVLLDSEGRVDTAAQRIGGLRAEDVLGKHFSIFFPEDAVREGAPGKALRFAIDHGRFDQPQWQVRADGSKFLARVIILPLKEEGGAVRGFVKISHDLTQEELARENQRLLEEARSAESRQRLLSHLSASLGTSLEAENHLEALDELVAAGFADAVVFHHETVSEGVSRFHPVVVSEGVVENRPLLSSWAEACSSDSECPGAVGQTLQDRQPLVVTDPSTLGVTEQTRAVLAKLKYRAALLIPMVAHDRVVGFLTVFRRHADPFNELDLTFANEAGQRVAYAVDNSRLYRLARDAVGLRDVFLSVAAHELKTPISALRLSLQSVQLMQQRSPPPPDAPAILARKLEIAVKQTRRLGTLVEELLEVSRIDSGRVSLRLENTDVGALAREVAQSMADSAARAGSTLRVSVSDEVTAPLDRVRLEQVLTNLLANAIKFGGGRPVDLEVKNAGELLLITVRDRGIGIDKKDLGRIFGRFERAVPAAHFGGMGLGLFIAHEIVEAHHGHIEVRSVRGEGSAFIVTLPKARKEATEEPRVVH